MWEPKNIHKIQYLQKYCKESLQIWHIFYILYHMYVIQMGNN